MLNVIQRQFETSHRELHIGGVSVRDVVEAYGTPLYVYDREILDRQWCRLRRALPDRFSIYYSIKANPNQAFLRYFLARDCGLEVASAGELHQALSAGCAADKIIFAGPGKTEAELESALTNEIGEIHIESLREAQRIKSISRRLGKKSRIALRINPTGEAQGGAMRMGGKPSPFGIDEEQLDAALIALRSDIGIDVQGIHLYIGTQILDDATIVNQYRKGIELATRVAATLGTPLETLNFGGGFGIPYFGSEQPLNLDRLGESLATLMSKVENEPLLSGTRFVVEPGRFLVGEAGVYVVRVNDIKVSRGTKYMIVDGGMNHHLAASGNLGQVIKRNYPVALLNKVGTAAAEKVHIVGPLCTPLDVIGRGVELPAPEVGDLVGVFQSGAYARSASPLDFLSHPAPPEVWIEDRRAHLIRARGSHEDYLRDQSRVNDSSVDAVLSQEEDFQRAEYLSGPGPDRMQVGYGQPEDVP